MTLEQEIAVMMIEYFNAKTVNDMEKR